MPVAKRERSSTAPANDQKPKLPPKNPKATPASKARIDSNAKTAMAEHIIAKGIATVNPQELAEIVCPCPSLSPDAADET